MNSCTYKCIYTSTSCNRTPQCLDWGNNGLVCYGACNAVCVFDPKIKTCGKILRSLHQHTKRVNFVQWVRPIDSAPETELVSASADCTAVIWKMNVDMKFSLQELKGHENGVTVADAMYLETYNSSTILPMLVITASFDSTLKIWFRNKDFDETKLLQTINYGHGFCLCAKIHFLQNSDRIILASSSDDWKINLFVALKQDLYSISEDGYQFFNKVYSIVSHEDWVVGLDFMTRDNNEVFLASCSQDSTIRLWKICKVNDRMEFKDDYQQVLDENISPEGRIFDVSTRDNNSLLQFTVSMESVLSGHEGWVYSVCWHPKLKDGSYQPMKLLSSSMDKTFILWTEDKESGVWIEESRMGEFSEFFEGYFGAKFSSDGQSILAYGYQGSFHMWRFNKDTHLWEPDVPFVGGHFGSVEDLAWSPNGEFLLSVSSDQTTRIHAQWEKDKEESPWHEVCRPQIHGYDLTCVAMLSPYRFVSGSEEKICRVFQAPKYFAQRIQSANQIDGNKFQELVESKGAFVPALGLSNKAVIEESSKLTSDINHANDHQKIQLLSESPTEDILVQSLWPEIQKLYGHGYEIYSLASRYDGKVLASSSKATSCEHAAILLWDTSSWKHVQKLSSHNLTITQMEFSPDGLYLLSVSRDRTWTVFQAESLEPELSLTYSLIASSGKKNKIHSRIIWCCSWSHDSQYFATGSRDGLVAIWGETNNTIPDEKFVCVGKPLELKNMSVTAVAFSKRLINDANYFIAVGLESGEIVLYRWTLADPWEKYLHLNTRLAHHLAVKRLSFRPVPKQNSCNIYLASCGVDSFVKIYKLCFE